MDFVPFNRPFLTGAEWDRIREAVGNRQLSGNGPFTAKCQHWLEQRTGSPRALLTQSCTAALEMSAVLADIGPGDEVIMPSFTFVSTANAFVVRSAVPVFVDIRSDTLNLDERLVESAITPRTKAIVAVHYAGVGCEMDALAEIARRHGLLVIEDAAQGLTSSYRGRALGSIGDLATLSFHETKNLMSGEGGALLVNDARLTGRAEIVWQKGTNRSQFERGEVQKYTWVDVGSSYLPSELTAAFLWAQLEAADSINASRRVAWDRYHDAFADLEATGHIRRPVVPETCDHNAHLYYLLVSDRETRDRALRELNARGINAVFHYVPLHSSPAGQRFGRAAGELPITDDASGRLLRLPLWTEMPADVMDRVIVVSRSVLGGLC
jgi:dTDP-4-amino-4,6-dideoxygalactose transaminase